MSLEALLPSAIDGLMLGFVYGLAALGLTLIFGVMKVINLSHGPIIALGMFAVFILFSSFGVNPYLGVIAAALVGLLLGIAIYFVAVDRVINATELTTLLATFSVNLMIIGVATVIFTTSPRSVDIDLGALRAGNVTILGTHGVAVAVALPRRGPRHGLPLPTPPPQAVRPASHHPAPAARIGVDFPRLPALALFH